MMKISLMDTTKKLIFWAGVICLLIFGVGAFFSSDALLAWFLGVLLGFAATVVRIVLLDHSVNTAVDMDRKRASGYSQLWFLIRFAAAGAALLLAALMPHVFSLVGAALALFSMQFAAYAVRIFNKDGIDANALKKGGENK